MQASKRAREHASTRASRSLTCDEGGTESDEGITLDAATKPADSAGADAGAPAAGSSPALPGAAPPPLSADATSPILAVMAAATEGSVGAPSTAAAWEGTGWEGTG